MKRLDWSALDRALTQVRAEKGHLPIWWRDDDAVTVTTALEALSELSETLGLSVHVATIPKLADKGLAGFVQARNHVVPVVHGWQHKNHADQSFKKSEFGQPRPSGHEEIKQAHAEMKRLFGAHYLALFVPPWNRLDGSFLPTLHSSGLRGLSKFGPRKSTHADSGILQINTHIDPIDWHGTRDLRDPEDLIAEVAARIRARCEGVEDPTEPLGYLTHHLIHSEDVWLFTEQLLNRLLDGGATPQPIVHLLENPS